VNTHATAPDAQRLNTAVVALVCVLLAIVALWQLSTQLSSGRLLWVALLTLPLWLPLRSLMRGNRRTHAAMTLCVIPYFVLGTVEAMANPAARWWAAACLMGALLLFVALIGYLRMTRGREEARR
jgi:uncharacterized membrane protein